MTTEKKFEQKPNSGALFKNTQKCSETDAEYTGSLNIEGRDFWLNAWVNEAKSGQRYFRVTVKPKDATSTSSTKRKASLADEMSDALPF